MAKRNVKSKIGTVEGRAQLAGKRAAKIQGPDGQYYDPGPKDSNDPRPHFYTESGLKIHVRAIELDGLNLIDEGARKYYRNLGEPVDPPTIEVKTAGGDKVKRPLTERNLTVENDPEETERRQALWDAHLAALNKVAVEIGRVSAEYLLDGIDEQLPEDDGWARKLEHWHFEIPDDPVLREIVYKQRVLIKTPVDFARMQAEIMMISSSGTMDREEIDAQIASFFRDIRLRPAKVDPQGVEGETTPGPVES